MCVLDVWDSNVFIVSGQDQFGNLVLWIVSTLVYLSKYTCGYQCIFAHVCISLCRRHSASTSNPNFDFVKRLNVTSIHRFVIWNKEKWVGIYLNTLTQILRFPMTVFTDDYQQWIRVSIRIVKFLVKKRRRRRRRK